MPGSAAQRWLEARQADLLPVEYYHVVFTLPAPISAIAYTNKEIIYDLLFDVAAETLRTIAADPKHLGARIGVTLVLHTWGSALTHHPHVHGIVPGGGLAPDGERWVTCKPGFFLPVRVLSRLFRRRFLEELATAHRIGRLQFFGEYAGLADVRAFATGSRRCAKWSGSSMPNARSPDRRRCSLICPATRTELRFRTSACWLSTSVASPSAGRITAPRADALQDHDLGADEFMRRFLLHVLPGGFHRIRHYGLLANGGRREHLARARELLHVVPTAAAPPALVAAPVAIVPPTFVCPHCGAAMMVIDTFVRGEPIRAPPALPVAA